MSETRPIPRTPPQNLLMPIKLLLLAQNLYFLSKVLFTFGSMIYLGYASMWRFKYEINSTGFPRH